jgi:hypothetical protein
MRYLTITYVTKPNGQIDEATAVTKNLKPRDLQTANVILDFKLQQVTKCTMNGVVVPKDWDRIVSYYYQYYANIIERLFTENGHPINIVAQGDDHEKQNNSN